MLKAVSFAPSGICMDCINSYLAVKPGSGKMDGVIIFAILDRIYQINLITW